jgi:putative DNA primase/helicase
VTAAIIIAKALSGRKAGGGWIARCPAHHDQKPSLSICDADEGGILIRCHAGCGQEQVIASLRSRGLWTDSSRRPFGHVACRSSSAAVDRDEAKRTEAALATWLAAKPSSGTLVDTYLVSRGLSLPPTPMLRFHAELKHPSGGFWPAMIALVTRGADNSPLAIHRTFLARDGAAKAPIDPQKMMLGPCRGGAVRLAELGEVLMVGEGIETCLAAMQASGHPAWAALSTSGLRSLDLPTSVRDVIVLADGDEAGEAAARDCAWRWKHEGRRVRIARPPQGMDFNDLLVGSVPRIEKAWNDHRQ